MSGRGRDDPEYWAELQAELDALEATNPAVRAAAQKFDALRAQALPPAKPRCANADLCDPPLSEDEAKYFCDVWEASEGPDCGRTCIFANDNVARMKRQISEAQTGIEPEGEPLTDTQLGAVGRRQ